MKRGHLLNSTALMVLLLPGCSHKEEIARLSEEASQAETRGERAAAIVRWSGVLKLAPKNGDALLHRATLYETTGDSEKAIGDYSAYLLLPTNRPAPARAFPIPLRREEPASDFGGDRSYWLFRRGLLYAKQHEFEKAQNDMNEAARLNPRGSLSYIGLAHVHELRGDPEQTLACLTKAIKVAPGEATGYSTRGMFYVRRGQFVKGIADLDEAIRLDPYDAEARMQRGLAYGRHREIDKALDDLDEAVHLSPNEPNVYAARGALFADEGRYQEAFEDFNHVLLLRPNEPFALARRGLTLAKKGELESALADLNQAIRLNPSEASFYASRASVYSTTNEFEGALKDFDYALRLNPSEPSFYAARGYVYNKIERYDLAVADFQQGIRLSPGSAEALNSLAWLRATCPKAEFRNGKEALELAARACDLTGYNHASLLDTLAAACAETGDFAEAVCWQQRSLERLPPNDKKRAAMQQRSALYQQSLPFRQTPGQ